MSSGSAGTSTNDQMNKATDQAQEKVGQAKEKATEVKDQATEKAGEVKDQAMEKADQGLDKASAGLSTAADKLREQSGESGPLPAQVSVVADQLEKASSYFEGKDTNEIISDLETLIRNKPVESVVGAVAIGFILAKIIR